MRFVCLNPDCARYFGWTAKRIITDKNIVWEYVVCPYCGSLDFDELPRDYKPASKPSKPVRMPKPANIPDFDQADLMEHSWKGKKIPNTKPQQWENGSVDFGWDFEKFFKPETIEVLAKEPLTIGEHIFTFTGKIVQVKKAKQ